MPIDPSIPLQTLIRPQDLGGAYFKGVEAGQSQRLREMQIDEATRQQEEGRALRDVYRSHAESGTVGSEDFLTDVGTISPGTSMRFRKERDEGIKRKLSIQQDFLKQAQETNEFILQKIGACIDLGDTPEGQACYERSKSEAKDFLSAAGIDTKMVDSLPERIDVQMLNNVRMQRLSTKEQLDIAWREKETERKVAEQQMLQAGRVEEARLKAEATEPSRLRVAERRGVQAAERQAEAQIRAAEIEKTAKPITGAEAKAVADIDTTLELLGDIDDIFKPEFVGQVAGRAGKLREVTGQISDDEVELRQVVADVKDSLLRARSGAAITESEYRRLSAIVPNITDQPNVFKAKLRRFRRNLQRLRSSKMAVATTGRGELQGAGVSLDTPIPPSDDDPIGIR
ncbi:MAG: cell envelope integrity protein TolA [Gammaproteobacteria bacterium]